MPTAPTGLRPIVSARTRHTRLCMRESKSRWCCVLETLPRSCCSLRDSQISEVCNCSGPNPQRNRPFALPLLEIIDQQRRLLYAVHIQSCLFTTHFNSQP